MIEKVFDGYYNVFEQEELGQKYTWASRGDVPFKTTPKIDCVSIAAHHEDTNELVIIDQYRPAVGCFVTELPAGKVDNNETVIEAAFRELKEETGLEGYGPIWKFSRVFSSAGLTDESHAVVICKCKGKISDKFNQGDESINARFASAEVLLRRLESYAGNISLGLAHYIMGMHYQQLLKGL